MFEYLIDPIYKFLYSTGKIIQDSFPDETLTRQVATNIPQYQLVVSVASATLIIFSSLYVYKTQIKPRDLEEKFGQTITDFSFLLWMFGLISVSGKIHESATELPIEVTIGVLIVAVSVVFISSVKNRTSLIWKGCLFVFLIVAFLPFFHAVFKYLISNPDLLLLGGISYLTLVTQFIPSKDRREKHGYRAVNTQLKQNESVDVILNERSTIIYYINWLFPDARRFGKIETRIYTQNILEYISGLSMNNAKIESKVGWDENKIEIIENESQSIYRETTKFYENKSDQILSKMSIIGKRGTVSFQSGLIIPESGEVRHIYEGEPVENPFDLVESISITEQYTQISLNMVDEIDFKEKYESSFTGFRFIWGLSSETSNSTQTGFFWMKKLYWWWTFCLIKTYLMKIE